MFACILSSLVIVQGKTKKGYSSADKVKTVEEGACIVLLLQSTSRNVPIFKPSNYCLSRSSFTRGSCLTESYTGVLVVSLRILSRVWIGEPLDEDKAKLEPGEGGSKSIRLRLV